MDVTVTEREGAVIFRPNQARIDALVAPEFRRVLGARAKGASRVVVDLTAVAFIDSSGLGTLVAVLRELAPGGRLHLSGVNDSVSGLLRITRLSRIFSVFGTVDEAVKA